MIELILIVVVVFIGIKLSSLSDQVKELRAQVSNLNPSRQPNYNQQAGQQQVAQSQQMQTNQEQLVQNPANQSVDNQQYVNPLTPDKPSAVDNFVVWIKDNWLLKLGVFLILIGFGWFISYAFVHNWIGPIGRVALGFVTGSLLALFGSYRMTKSLTQGKLFLILGSALVVITSYAARAVYDFFDPIVALGIVFLVSAYVSTIALQFRLKEIATYGLIMAFLAPLLTHARIETELIFSYLIVVSLASIWLASIRGWSFINALAIAGLSLYALPEILSYRTGDGDFILFAVFGVGLIYFVVSIIGSIRNNQKAGTSDLIVAILDSILITIATIQIIPEELQSIVLAGWMIVFAVGSFVVFNYTKKESFFYVYSLIAIALLAIATALELDGSALIYAYAFESAAISVAGYVITRKLNVGYSLSLLMIGPALMSLPSIASSKWNTGIMHDDFGVLLTMGILTVALGMFYYYSSLEADRYGDVAKEKFYSVLNVVGSVYFLALVWLSSGALIANEGTAVMVALVVYTIVGISTYFYGLINLRKEFKYYGAVLLIIVVGRLLLVDVWDMELAARVVTFILIGVLFISTAFIGNKVKDQKHLSDNMNQQ